LHQIESLQEANGRVEINVGRLQAGSQLSSCLAIVHRIDPTTVMRT
jgi:hypothetical protein